MAKLAPDPVLCKDQLQALQAMLKAWGIRWFLHAMFWILVKKPEATTTDSGILRPFKLNKIQDSIESKLGQDNVIVKPRQVGETTYFMLRRLFTSAITEPGTGCLLIAQNNEYAEKIFRMCSRAYKHIGKQDPYDPDANALSISLKQNLLHTGTSNRREIIFDQLDSTIQIASAEVEESGQSITLKHIFADEYSRWPRNPESTLANARAALVPGGTLDIACTANGAGGPFHELVMRCLMNPGRSEATLHYHSWWWQDEYDFPELSMEEKDKLIEEMTEEEFATIFKMHTDLSTVAYVG